MTKICKLFSWSTELRYNIRVQRVKSSSTHHIQNLQYSDWNTLTFRYLSTKIHKNVTILKFLQKSQKQIISRYSECPDLIKKWRILNVNIFVIFANISPKLCNQVLIDRIDNQNWNYNCLTNSNYDENWRRFSIFPQKNPILFYFFFRWKIAKSQTPKSVAFSTMWFSQHHLW